MYKMSEDMEYQPLRQLQPDQQHIGYTPPINDYSDAPRDHCQRYNNR